MSEQQEIQLRAQRLIATADYRSLSRHKQACKLVCEANFSNAVASKATGMSITSVRRALKAIDVGRIPGTRGRPEVFTGQDKENWVEIIKKNTMDGASFEYSDARDAVIKYFSQIINNNE